VWSGDGVRPAAVMVSGHFDQERTANIFPRLEEQRPEKRIEKGETNMPKERVRECVNCGRKRMIFKAGLCWICSKSVKGLEGDARAAALAEIKTKIESGEAGIGKGIHKCGRGGKRKDPALAPSGGETKPMSPEAIAEVKKRVKALREKRDGGFVPGVLIESATANEIPVTIRLTIEVGIRLIGLQG
jgi:hypothetical protein